MSEKKIEDYLHLYLGCECICTNERDIQTLTCVEPVMKKAWMITGISYHIDVVKPILRPLSDMTEEENTICNEFVIGCSANDNPNPMYWTPLQFNYLLKQHFDLFGLIDAGLAIKKL